MAVGSRPLNSDTLVRSQSVPSYVVNTVALRQVFIQVPLFSPVSFVPPMPHSQIYLHVAVGQAGDDWERPKNMNVLPGSGETLLG